MLEAAAVTQPVPTAGAGCWQRAPGVKRSQLCKAPGAASGAPCGQAGSPRVFRLQSALRVGAGEGGWRCRLCLSSSIHRALSSRSWRGRGGGRKGLQFCPWLGLAVWAACCLSHLPVRGAPSGPGSPRLSALPRRGRVLPAHGATAR